MATSPRCWVSSRKSDRCASLRLLEAPLFLPRDQLCTSSARNEHGLAPSLWSVWRLRQPNPPATRVAHRFYRFCFFSMSSFRKQDMAHSQGFTGDGLIILISTAIYYYYY